MKLTKYTHACIRLDEDGDRSLVIDPGVFSESADALTGTQAVLLTHLHADHLDIDALASAAAAEPALHIWAPADAAGQLATRSELADRFTIVDAGQSFVAGGLQVRTYGGQHALIHSSIPTISNVAYLVGDAVYDPGDSFTVPNATVDTALVPIHAPWSKTSEVMDYAIAVRAARGLPLHDSLLTDVGRSMVEGLLTGGLADYQLSYRHLSPLDSIDL
ncbi:MAG: fold metallo-hydrolase [Frankiales bacterium]|nr:fold metallo-hydrolase [Frankiales bacterium]